MGSRGLVEIEVNLLLYEIYHKYVLNFIIALLLKPPLAAVLWMWHDWNQPCNLNTTKIHLQWHNMKQFKTSYEVSQRVKAIYKTTNDKFNKKKQRKSSSKPKAFMTQVDDISLKCFLSEHIINHIDREVIWQGMAMGGELEPGSYLGLYQPTLLVTPRALYNIIVQYHCTICTH